MVFFLIQILKRPTVFDFKWYHWYGIKHIKYMSFLVKVTKISFFLRATNNHLY